MNLLDELRLARQRARTAKMPLHRATILATDNVLRQAHLARHPGRAAGSRRDVPRTGDELKRLKKAAREKASRTSSGCSCIEALKRNDWNVTRSAEDTGMLRSNFQALMKKHNIRVRDREAGADEALPPDSGRAPIP